MLRAATLKENGLPAELPQFAYPQRICVRRLVDAKMAHFMRSFGLCTPPKKKAPETCARDFFGVPAGKRFEHERLLDSRKIGDYRPGYVVFELRNLKQSFSGRFCVPNNCRFLFHFCI